MAKRRLAIENKQRMEDRNKVLRWAWHVFLGVACLSLGFVVLATAVPQKRVLEEVEFKLAKAKEREREVLAEREYYEIENRALKDDPEFLELHARDRLNLYREGERVLKFRRAE